MSTSVLARGSLALGALLAFTLAGIVDAAEQRRTRDPARGQAQPAASTEIRTTRVRDDIYVFLGAGGNITAQVGPRGVLLVNTGNAGTSDAVLAALRRVTDRPLRMILNTGAEPHVSGGNEALHHAGRYIADRGEVNWAQISAHEAVLDRLGRERPDSPGAWPTDVFFTESLEFYFNDQGVVMYHMPAARSAGNSIVYFRRSDVIVAGDLFLQNTYPVIDVEQGGSLEGVIDALNRMVAIAIPGEYQEGGTMIVSGDGRASDEYELVTYRDMVTIFRDRIADMIDRGMTLEQVLAAKPTSDYDGRYGDDPAWTPEQFVTAAYRSLAASPDMTRAGE